MLSYNFHYSLLRQFDMSIYDKFEIDKNLLDYVDAKK